MLVAAVFCRIHQQFIDDQRQWHGCLFGKIPPGRFAIDRYVAAEQSSGVGADSVDKVLPASLQVEILTLRHQLNVLRRKSPQRLAFTSVDRLVFAGLYRLAPGVLDADREHPRGRTHMVRDGKRDKVKLDEFAAAIETAKTLAETKHFQTVYVINEADAERTIGQPKPR